jgi:hypothetical protein
MWPASVQHSPHLRHMVLKEGGGVLEEDDPADPLIKIVFALAARTASQCCPPRSNKGLSCRGLRDLVCRAFIGPIIPQETGIWDSPLQASYGWKELYKTASKVTVTLRQSATPGARTSFDLETNRIGAVQRGLSICIVWIERERPSSEIGNG